MPLGRKSPVVGGPLPLAVTVLVLSMLVMPLLVGGCSGEDEGFRCTDTGVDPRLVGDWMRCSEEGAFETSGLSIQSDGSTFILGIDWRNGSVAVAEESCSPFILRCAGANRITWPMIPGGHDTLRFTVEGDRLELVGQPSNVNVRRYRRVSPGQVIASPVHAAFSGMLGNEPWHAPDVWMDIPVRGFIDPLHGSLTLFIAGRKNFSAYIPDFRGTGSYTMGRDLDSGAAGIGHPCSDVVWDIMTRDDSLSTITITLADTLAQRIEGSLDLMLHNGQGNAWHVTGSFEGVMER